MTHLSSREGKEVSLGLLCSSQGRSLWTGKAGNCLGPRVVGGPPRVRPEGCFFFFTINKGVSCQGYWGLKKYWRLFLLYRSQNVVTPMTTSSSLNKHRAIINDISVASKKPPLRGPMSHGRPPIRSVNKKIKKTIRSVDSVHTVCTEFNVHSGSFKWSRRWRKMKRSYPSGSEKRKKKKEDEDRRKQDSGKWSR